MSTSEISALIQLLEDDSANVLEAVTVRLESLVPESLPALREAAESENAKVRGRARELLRILAVRSAGQELLALAESADPDLEMMSLQLARMQDATVRFELVREQLDAFAETARAAMAEGLRGRERIEAFLRVIHDELGFAGDTENFEAYANNFLPSVIKRRRGIPITLVLLYILVGRRIGLRIDAVGAPFRALAFYADGGYETYIDAFGGGRLQTYHDCVSHLKSRGMNIPDSRQYLRRLSPREVVERMVRNLVIFCDQSGRPIEGREFKRLERALVKNRDRDRLA